MINLRKNIIELLIQNGLLTYAQVEQAYADQKSSQESFSSLLIEKGFILEKELSAFISANVNPPKMYGAQLAQLKIAPEVIKIITQEKAERYSILPLSKSGQRLTVCICSLVSIIDIEDLEELKGQDINPVITSEPELKDLIARSYLEKPQEVENASTMKEIFGAISEQLPLSSSEEINFSELLRLSKETPIVKATDLILEKAIECKTSDVFIEPLSKFTRVRFRIDGVLQQIETFPSTYHPFIISRIKVMSNLDIAEHRLPQDGQFKMRSGSRDIDFRVSVFPTVNGEKIVVRLLDKTAGNVGLEKLGLSQEKLERLKKTAHIPHGMILTCGPTGSGKTSTLYSILKYVHSPEKNIITVEDPVEYQLRGINQVSVNMKTGLTFSRSLRAILRQDPDIIMIGEIRDFETVDIAIKAALTGHLVLSTLHTNTACSSVVRLVDMGVEPFLINASLTCVVSQRLARRLCLVCKEPDPGQPYFRGRGCKDCHNSGYNGRVLISEMLYMSPEIRRAVVSKELSEGVIREIAVSQGMKTLREEGKAMALSGITSYEEILRVTPADT